MLFGFWCLLFGVLSCGVVWLLVLIVWCVELWCCLGVWCLLFGVLNCGVAWVSGAYCLVC